MCRSVFSRLAHLSCLYTVSLTPRTDRSSLEVVVFPPPEDDQVTVTSKVSTKLSIICLRSRPGDPDVVCLSVHCNIEMSDQVAK